MHETGNQALDLSVKRQTELLPKYMFSMRQLPQSRTGLVQQRVQIVASHDLTLVVIYILANFTSRNQTKKLELLGRTLPLLHE